MPEQNVLRLFEEGRLHPWKPDNKVQIDAHLAMLSVTNPKLAAELTEKYAKKLDEHLAKAEKKEQKPITADLLHASLKVAGKPIGEVKEEKPKVKKLSKILSPSSDVKHV